MQKIGDQKARIVADMVRGKMVNEAIRLLTYDNKKPSMIIKKLVESAIANAEKKEVIDVDHLYIKEIMVDKRAFYKKASTPGSGPGLCYQKEIQPHKSGVWMRGNCLWVRKFSPISLRVGVIRSWESRWYAKGRLYSNQLHEDLRLREYLKKKLKHAGVSKIEMERAANKLKVIISTARPGVVIGKQGVVIDSIKKDLQKMTPQ